MEERGFTSGNQKRSRPTKDPKSRSSGRRIAPCVIAPTTMTVRAPRRLLLAATGMLLLRLTVLLVATKVHTREKSIVQYCRRFIAAGGVVRLLYGTPEYERTTQTCASTEQTTERSDPTLAASAAAPDFSSPYYYSQTRYWSVKRKDRVRHSCDCTSRADPSNRSIHLARIWDWRLLHTRRHDRKIRS